MKTSRLNIKMLIMATGLLLAWTLTAQAMTFTAYEVPAGTQGNQSWEGALGMDFNVLQDINVLSLGAFDDDSDGLKLPITVQIFDRTNTATALAERSFAIGNTGTLEGGSRFLDLSTPLTLLAGFQGTVVAYGYGPEEQNGNRAVSPNPTLGTTNDGGGLLQFSNLARWSNSSNVYPELNGTYFTNTFAAGTFKYEAVPAPVPEPGSLLLLGLGLLGLGAYGRKRTK